VREPCSNAELEEAAQIRADCFYEAMVPMPRFAASLAKKMAGEEYRGLLQRTAIQTDGRLRCICLVAVSPDAHVCGSLDLRLPAEASGCHPPGVPEDDPGGAFLVNVAVHRRFRGQGVGRTLISGAIRTAAQRVMAKRLYTHVDCDNDAAWRLYQQHGFDIHDDAACSLPGGRLILVSHLTV
jgi:ribosomal protein S18 acetylase RimI-like enzyme